MNNLTEGRRDYLFLSNPEADLTQDEIVYDFNEKGVAFGYVQELAQQKADVILLDSKYQREATVVDFKDGVATFKCKSMFGE